MSTQGSSILRQRTPQPASPPNEPRLDTGSPRAHPGMLPVLPTTPSSGPGAAGHSAHRRPHITDFTISLDEVDGRTVGVDGSGGARARASLGPEPGPPRWRTREFMLYGLVFVLVVPVLVYWPMRLSRPSHPNFPAYAHRLSPGWLFGRQVDASDPQYRTFRNNLLPLVLLASTYLVASSAQRRLYPSPSHRAFFIAVFSTIMLFALHGVSAIKIFAILYINYLVSTAPKPPAVVKLWPALLIAGNMVLLFLNERYDGYKLGGLHAFFEPIDAMGGLLPRWHVGFNITMLRMVSFGLDHHWRETVSPGEAPVDHRARTRTSLAKDQYSWLNFLAYCLYPPLYVGGPVMTFNDFAWQLQRPVQLSARSRVSYLVRFLFCILTMESVLHTMYVVAIKDTSAWQGDSAADLSMIGFWNLVVVWLKLLIPWRFFRLWALWDGVDPPENMIRCVANNYSTLGFWRSWHRSYNLWLIRYIYIPVGGSKNMVLATVLVFTFVALWHDLSFKLLAWGWLVSLFILPEIIARELVSFERYGHERWYRHVAAAGGVVNILMMMAANLVGFVLGLDGVKHLVRELVSTASGWMFTLFSCFCLFVAVQVMFEYREEERRRGVDRKC